MLHLLYLLFFLSGAAALMYESVWARYLGLFVGHEAYAQLLVLVIFLGGMALGAALVARYAERRRDPLRDYALAEAGVGLLGLLFHPAFVAATGWAYDRGFPLLGEGPGAALLKWSVAALLILPQSILLGTTFPLLSAAVLRRVPGRPGGVLSWLYFANSLGAAIGVLVAGFVILGLAGLPGVLSVAAALNLVVAAASFAARRIGSRRKDPLSPPATAAMEPGPVLSARTTRLLLVAAFLTAVASFAYETDWIRMLSLLLGSATHSFELMLSGFILGLALGAFWIRSRIDRLRNPLRTLGLIQVVMGLLAVATLPVYLAAFDGMAWLLEALDRSGPGYVLFTIVRYGLALSVMLPATVCAGMTLPLITRILVVQQRSEAPIGRVYALNTLGAIVGVGLAGLVLLPWLGVKGLLVVAGLLDIGVGFALLRSLRGSSPRVLAVPLGALVVVLAHLALGVDQRRLVSGVFRDESFLQQMARTRIDYYADGRTATVSVSRWPAGHLTLATNGKVDASLSAEAQRGCQAQTPLRQLSGDEITQLLLGLLPLGFIASEAEVAVIGFGSGLTTHTLLASPSVRRVTTVEIEPRMVDGARQFFPANRRAFEDPRSQLRLGDARAFFAASQQRYQLIVSEPSNPWVSGVAALFTQEFYRRIRTRMSSDGIFAQWLQAYELRDESLLHVLAALDAVFPDWQVHQIGNRDLLILASAARTLPRPSWSAVTALPAVQRDFCGVIPLDSTALDAAFLADRALLAPAVRKAGRPNSDYSPFLDLHAERQRFMQEEAQGFLSLGDERFNSARHLMQRPALPIPVPQVIFDQSRRLTALYRQTWQTAPAANDTLSEPAAKGRFAWERWQVALSASNVPGDWSSWLAEHRDVSLVRHGGTAGWADSAFFRAAESFAQSRNAPLPVLEVIAFRRAVQAWDAATALELAERLVNRSTGYSRWVSGRELVDGAVVAALRGNRLRDARAWLTRLDNPRETNSSTLWWTLLLSLVEEEEPGVPVTR